MKAHVAISLADRGCPHDSPAHGEVCDKVCYIMGGLPHFSAHHSHLLVLVVATDITCQAQRHDYLVAVVVPEAKGTIKVKKRQVKKLIHSTNLEGLSVVEKQAVAKWNMKIELKW